MSHSIRKLGWGFGRCNQFCKHCYNASKPVAAEYTFKQLKQIADKVCPDISDINYGTGEFFSNPNTLFLADYIKKQYPKVKQALTSNGSTVIMINPEKILTIFHDVDVSLDFPDKKRHNAFRRHERAWDWVQDSLQILSDNNIPRTITSCVNSETTDEDIIGLLNTAQKYNAMWRINWFRCTGRGEKSLRISAERAWSIIEFLSDKVVFNCLDSIFAGPLEVPCRPCPAGYYSCRIHENMDSSCYPFLKGNYWSGGNLLDPKVNLETIYHSPAFVRLRNRMIPYCENCEFWSLCRGGCVTRGFLHNGGINQPDDYCPLRAGIMDKVKRIRIKYESSCNLVHDGYLCTTIMRPM